MRYVGHANRYLGAFLIIGLIIGATALLQGGQAAMQSSGSMEESYSMKLDEARAHVEEALALASENRFDKVGIHADMALRAAKNAESHFEKADIDKDARKRFSDGVKNLAELPDAIKKGDQKVIIDLLRQTRIHWLPYRVSDKEPCHGDGCPLKSNGSCQSPGTYGCDSFNKKKKCTDAYGGCYCLL